MKKELYRGKIACAAYQTDPEHDRRGWRNTRRKERKRKKKDSGEVKGEGEAKSQ